MDPVILTSVALGAAGAATGIAGNVYKNRIHKSHRERFRYLRILPHEVNICENQRIERLVDLFGGFNRTKSERMKKGRDWFRFLIHKDKGGKIAFYIGYPEDRTTGIKKAFTNCYPEAELHPIAHSEMPLPVISKEGYGGYFAHTRKGDYEGLPLKPFQASDDGLPDILSCLDAGEKDTDVWLDILFSPTSNRNIKKAVTRTQKAIIRSNSGGQGKGFSWNEFAGDFMAEITSNGPTKARSQRKTTTTKAINRDLDNEQQEQLRSLKRRFTGRESAFHVSIHLYVEGNYAPSIAQTAATSIKTTLALDNGLRLVTTKAKGSADTAPIPPSYQRMLWTGQELAHFLHLPAGDHSINEHIPHLKKGQRSLKDTELNTGVGIGYLNHPIAQGRSVKIPKEQFTKHFILTGMTGSGKSSEGVFVCQSLLDDWLEDPQNAAGFTYFDPARETVATILNRLLMAEKNGKKVDWSKVHYFYLGPSEYSLGLNFLHRVGNEESDSIVGDVLGIMKYAYGGDTPQMDRIVRNTLMTLVEDRDPHSILGVVPLLTDEDFRNRITPRIKDYSTKQFWKNDFPELQGKMGQAIGPILNRLSPFTDNRTMRRMFGQLDWGIDLRKYMEEGHIVLWDLLNVGSETVKLAGSHLANQYYKTAKTRRSGARKHIMMIDEAHDVQVPVIPKIIAETRKFGLCLGLITQFINQFNKDIIAAVTENVGTILTCTQGPTSASIVSSMTAGHFDKQYLQKLPERVIAVYTKTKGEDGRSAITTFTVEASPPFVYKPDGKIANHEVEKEMEEAIGWGLSKGQELLARDGKHGARVDEEIESYMKSGTVLKEVGRLDNTIPPSRPTIPMKSPAPSLRRGSANSLTGTENTLREQQPADTWHDF